MLTKRIVSYTGGLRTATCIKLLAAADPILALTHYRGAHRFARFVSALAESTNGTVILQFDHDCLLKIAISDPYWARLFLRGYEYEPGLRTVLSLFRDQSVFFIDGGANIGYWSVFASSRTFGPWRVCAVEASPTTFSLLQQNAALNGDRFACLNYAISDATGRQVTLARPYRRPAATHVTTVPTDEAAERAIVEHTTTASVDHVVKRHKGRAEHIIMKLDLEGEELNALRGAEWALQHDPLLIYEDHPRSLGSEVTAYVLKDLGYDVYYCSDSSNVLRISNLMAVSEIKRRRLNYNFVACNPSSMFSEHLSSLLSPR